MWIELYKIWRRKNGKEERKCCEQNYVKGGLMREYWAKKGILPWFGIISLGLPSPLLHTLFLGGSAPIYVFHLSEEISRLTIKSSF